MAGTPRITLEQWRALQAVVEEGGYAQAAEKLHKSQSTVTYAVQQIQKLLDVRVFEIRGRKAVLTDAGKVLYRRARTLLDEAAQLERGAAEMARDWQPEVRIAVEHIFPTWVVLEALAEFANERPETRIELFETVMSGTDEMLAEGTVDIMIGGRPASREAKALVPLRVVPVASPSHPLHQLKRALTERDLKHHRRIFIRDTGTQRKAEVSGVERRWTVSNKATSIRALVMGLGFAWLPEDTVRSELDEGKLKILPMKEGGSFDAQLYLALSDPEFPGRDVERLAGIIEKRVSGGCNKAVAANPAAKAKRR
jgi:DNA-binding transcriptional LysR family regulator